MKSSGYDGPPRGVQTPIDRNYVLVGGIFDGTNVFIRLMLYLTSDVARRFRLHYLEKHAPMEMRDTSIAVE